MADWKNDTIIVRRDGSYLITSHGLPCHVPDAGEWAALHAEIAAYAAQHPQAVQPEPDPAPETPEAITRRYTTLIQRRLDAFAQTRMYDSMYALCSYATSQDPVFGVEGRYGVAVRDATWATGNAMLASALGTGTVPSWAEVEEALPPLVWPNAREAGGA